MTACLFNFNLQQTQSDFGSNQRVLAPYQTWQKKLPKIWFKRLIINRNNGIVPSNPDFFVRPFFSLYVSDQE